MAAGAAAFWAIGSGSFPSRRLAGQAAPAMPAAGGVAASRATARTKPVGFRRRLVYSRASLACYDPNAKGDDDKRGEFDSQARAHVILGRDG